MKKLFLIIVSVLFCFNYSLSQEYAGWQQLPPVGEHVRDFYGLHFFNKDSGCVAGWQRPDRSYTLLASTQDGGDNWNTMKVGDKGNLYDVTFINDSIGYCLDGDVLKTVDSGKNWFTVFDDIGGDLRNRVKFYDEKHGWAIGMDSTIVKTSDGGETWEYITVDSLTMQTISEISIIDTNIIYVSNTRSIHKTIDGGNTWFRLIKTDDFSNEFYDLIFYSELMGWIVGTHRTILFTDNGGKSWQDQSPPWGPDAFENIDAIDSLSAITVSSSGAIFRTDDGGQSWIEQVPEGIFPKFTAVQMIDSLTAYGVGFDGMVVKTTNGGVSWLGEIRGNKIPQAYNLYPAYPNPFNPVTTIRFEIPQKEFVEISVFNALGQKVQTLIAEKVNAGIHEVVFNASGLASGVYFYKFKAGFYKETKKMLLLR